MENGDCKASLLVVACQMKNRRETIFVPHKILVTIKFSINVKMFIVVYNVEIVQKEVLDALQ